MLTLPAPGSIYIEVYTRSRMVVHSTSWPKLARIPGLQTRSTCMPAMNSRFAVSVAVALAIALSGCQKAADKPAAAAPVWKLDESQLISPSASPPRISTPARTHASILPPMPTTNGLPRIPSPPTRPAGRIPGTERAFPAGAASTCGAGCRADRPDRHPQDHRRPLGHRHGRAAPERTGHGAAHQPPQGDRCADRWRIGGRAPAQGRGARRETRCSASARKRISTTPR